MILDIIILEFNMNIGQTSLKGLVIHNKILHRNAIFNRIMN